MATIFNHFYGNKNAFLNPCDVTEKISGFPEVCITTFSESIIKDFVKNGADNLDSDKWEIRDLTDYGLSYSNKYMTIALECGMAMNTVMTAAEIAQKHTC